MGREHETDIIPKMTYRWPTGTKKNPHISNDCQLLR